MATFEQRTSLIPRRIAFRAIADVLWSQAQRQESLPGRRAKFRPKQVPSAEKEAGRAEQIVKYQAMARELHRWARDAARIKGQPIDPTVFAYLLALAYGHYLVWGELKTRLAALGHPGLLDDLAVRDLVPAVDRLCPCVTADSPACHEMTGVTE